AGITARHGGKHRLDRVKRGLGGHQSGDLALTNDPHQEAFPRADTAHRVSTLPPRTPTYQTWTLQVGSQWPVTSFSFSLIFSTPSGSSTTPCSSLHLMYFTSSRP